MVGDGLAELRRALGRPASLLIDRVDMEIFAASKLLFEG
jgi:hypothetical protein